MDNKCLEALNKLGATKGRDALRAFSECNVRKIRNPSPYFMKIIKRRESGYLILDGKKKI